MAEIRWASSSLVDLRATLGYLAEKDPLAAERYSFDFEKAVERLRDWPWSGHPLLDYPKEVRQLLVAPYRIVYRVAV
ncbi:MAG: type II toxin-antitoxin system RelE/ParE family toxin [Vulcanimicrobiota bacterium]